MAKDNAQTIGQLIGHIGVRDAIHVPIISAVAKTDLAAGCPVRLLDTGEVEHVEMWQCVGVVDPFLGGHVQSGQQCWVFIKPGSISSLTHKWTHKGIPDIAEVVPDKEKARVRLEEFAEKHLHVSLADMLDSIESCRSGGDPLYDHGYEGLSEYEGFWADYETYTGKTDPNKEEGYFYFFTCGGCS